MTWNERICSKRTGTKRTHNLYTDNRFWVAHKREATERATNNITLVRGINKLLERNTTEPRVQQSLNKIFAVPFPFRLHKNLEPPRHRLLDFPFIELYLRNLLSTSINNQTHRFVQIFCIINHLSVLHGINCHIHYKKFPKPFDKKILIDYIPSNFAKNLECFTFTYWLVFSLSLNMFKKFGKFITTIQSAINS